MRDIHAESTVHNICRWLHLGLDVDETGARRALANIIEHSIEAPMLADDMLNELIAQSPQLRKSYNDFCDYVTIPHISVPVSAREVA